MEQAKINLCALEPDERNLFGESKSAANRFLYEMKTEKFKFHLCLWRWLKKKPMHQRVQLIKHGALFTKRGTQLDIICVTPDGHNNNTYAPPQN